MDPFRMIIGFAMLFTGRRLYWLFLGGVGFFLGYDFAREMIRSQPADVVFVVALAAGIAGAMLAIFFQKVAILIGGFVGGGYLLLELLRVFGVSAGHYHWLLFILGGIMGAVFMKVLFGWTLITLSAFLGSGLILRSSHLGPSLTRLLFISLFLLGIAVQSGIMFRSRPDNG